MYSTGKISIIAVIIVSLVFGVWFYAGFPRIWEKPAIPPRLKMVRAASVGPFNANTAVDDSSIGGTNAWTNPEFATSSDDNKASVSLPKNLFSHYLKATSRAGLSC